MADTKITALTAITTVDPANDVLPIVDVSDTSMAASGTTKKITTNQILGASGTATLASATITGDLTVDTNTLKVDSANNRVGVGTAIPLGPFHLVTTSAGFSEAGYFENSQAVGANVGPRISLLGAGSVAMSLIQSGWNAAANTDAYLAFLTRGSSSVAERYRIASDGVATWSNVGGVAGTAMTLNSTGLGVGGSPVNFPNYRTIHAIGKTTTAGGVFQTSTSDNSTAARFACSSAGVDLFVETNHPIAFYTNATVKMTLDASGNLGIGVTPSAWNSAYRAIEIAKTGNAIFSNNASNNNILFTQNAYYDGSWKYGYTALAAHYEIQNGAHKWNTAASGTAGNAITWTQAMTLDASGRLLVGVTSAIASGNTFQNLGSARQVLTLKGDDQTSYTFGVWSASATGDNLFQYFGTEATLTVRGSISYNRAGGLVAYNTTSDYRAKDIIGPVSNSGSLIDSLKVYVGKMKGATIERPMLIAHEAQEVAPYAVTGTKDEVDSDGKPKYQQMDASALVPLLIAEIQSLRARVQTLETR